MRTLAGQECGDKTGPSEERDQERQDQELITQIRHQGTGEVIHVDPKTDLDIRKTCTHPLKL